jgi:hypothetical protein
MRYICGGEVEDGKEILKVSITLKHTTLPLRNATYFRTFGDGIYSATFLVPHYHPSCTLPVEPFDLGVRDIKTGVWKGHIGYDNMEEFFEYWDILDRMVITEKVKRSI